MRVTLLYLEDCPHWRTADRHLRSLATELGFGLNRHVVESPEEAHEVGFLGSPTIIADGRDLFAKNEPGGFSCRIYETPDGLAGSPTLEQLRAALARASK